jgi:hypothetical protein
MWETGIVRVAVRGTRSERIQRQATKKRLNKQRGMCVKHKRMQSGEEVRSRGWRVGAGVVVLHWGLYLDPSGWTISMHREGNSEA